MKRNALKCLAVLSIAFLCGLGTLSAQEQQEKKVAYNFINEYGFFVGKNVGMTGVFINGISIKQNNTIGIGVGFHFWTNEYSIYDPNELDPWGNPTYNYYEENKHGIGLYSTIAGGFRVKAFSFTGGFFFRTFPNEEGFNGGIEAKVGYTF